MEIVAAKSGGPSRDWLNAERGFVKSPRARAKIRQWFAKERRDEAIDGGKDAITKEVRKVGLPIQRLFSAESMGAVATELRHADISSLYAAVGEGHTSAKHVVSRLVALIGGVDEAEEELAARATPSTVTRRRGSNSSPKATIQCDSGELA